MSIQLKVGKLGSNASAGHTVTFSGCTWHHIKILEKRTSRGIIQKCEPHERNRCAPRFAERSHEETSRQESWARRAAWDLAKKKTLKLNKDETTFSLVEIKTLMFIAKTQESVCLLIQVLLCTC